MQSQQADDCLSSFQFHLFIQFRLSIHFDDQTNMYDWYADMLCCKNLNFWIFWAAGHYIIQILKMFCEGEDYIFSLVELFGESDLDNKFSD